MKVPFLDLKKQWQALKQEIEPEVLKVFESGSFIGGDFALILRSRCKSILECGMQSAVIVVRMH